MEDGLKTRMRAMPGQGSDWGSVVERGGHSLLPEDSEEGLYRRGVYEFGYG
jgi:hypothetical protein